MGKGRKTNRNREEIKEGMVRLANLCVVGKVKLKGVKLYAFNGGLGDYVYEQIAYDLGVIGIEMQAATHEREILSRRNAGRLAKVIVGQRKTIRYLEGELVLREEKFLDYVQQLRRDNDAALDPYMPDEEVRRLLCEGEKGSDKD